MVDEAEKREVSQALDEQRWKNEHKTMESSLK